MRPDLDEKRTTELLAELEARRAFACADCGRAVDAHAYVANVALGFKDRPRCAPCLAAVHGRHLGSFLRDLAAYVRGRACYRAGWEWAGREAGHGPEREPGERWIAAQEGR